MPAQEQTPLKQPPISAAPSPEQSPARPEQGADQPSAPEQPSAPPQEGAEPVPPTPPADAPVTTAAQALTNEQLAAIESILAEDIASLYESLSSEEQERFRASGEETARAIDGLLAKAKIQFAKIVSLIKKWLSLLPGVNTFYIEHEAKVKTKKIIALHDKQAEQADKNKIE